MSVNKPQEDDIIQRHKRERDELEAKITNLKRSIPKDDRKKKREVGDEIARLQADLQTRHDQELEEYELVQKLQQSTVNDSDDKVGDASNKGRVSKAQKRREKKELKDKQRQEDIKEQEKLNLTGARHLEAEKLKSVINERGLEIYEIPSDGDCLYSAIIHQLSLHREKLTVQELRRQTAQFMRQNQDEFLPFLCDLDSDSFPTDDTFKEYCFAIENTPAWGGQLELRAISQVLKRPIEVIQAAGQNILIGEEYDSDGLLTITYHRHAYGLGEHFNSVTRVDTA